MDSQTVQNAIRDPSTENASEIMSDITPNIMRDVLPAIFGQLGNGVDSEVLAESTLDQIFNVVETKILGDGVDFVIERYGDRIVDLVTGNMSSVFERVTMMLIGGWLEIK